MDPYDEVMRPSLTPDAICCSGRQSNKKARPIAEAISSQAAVSTARRFRAVCPASLLDMLRQDHSIAHIQSACVHSGESKLKPQKSEAIYELALGGISVRVHFELRFSGDHVVVDKKGGPRVVGHGLLRLVSASL